MEEIIGTSNRILEIDLNTNTFSIYSVTQKDREMYLGAKGLGLKLLYDRLKIGCDPLGEENIIIFMMGVLMGTGAPCSGRFEAITKSPLTGIMTTASCGGPFGMALKTSGWDGIIVKGRAIIKTHLVIDAKGVTFKPADDLWGKDTRETQEILSKDGSGSVVIGQAGENLVRFANICSGHRFLGRGGMGAVFGSKNIKAITAKGKEFKIIPKNKKMFGKAKKGMLKYINQNDITSGSYRDLGTNANVNLSNAGGILPVRNFTGGIHKNADKISGEYIKDKYDTKHHTCKPCSILCGHQGTFDGEKRAVPEYETTGLLGSNIGIFDQVKISEFNETCSEIGMDTISAGGTIAWAMEATEKGLIESNLSFGKADGVGQMLRDIATRKGLGNELAEGSRRASQKFGGQEYAIHVKGLEMAAYDPRGCFGQGLSYAVANRGACHLSTSLFTLEVYFNMASPKAKRGKATMVKFFENVYSALNSLQICHFTAFAVFLEPPLIKYTPTPLLKLAVQNLTPVALALMDLRLWPALWSSVTGIKLGMQGFKKAGERIHVLERYMNTREGISAKDDTLPARLLEEGRDCDNMNLTVPLDKMLHKYYKIRGYDTNGIPTDSLLEELGIEKK